MRSWRGYLMQRWPGAVASGVLVCILTACTPPATPLIVSSPFAVDTSLFGAALDAITAREVAGKVRVVPYPMISPDLRGIPLPVQQAPVSLTELAERKRTVIALGFALDSVADPGNCPGFWSQAEARAACPQVATTTVVASWPRELESSDREYFARTFGSEDLPTVVVRLMFVATTPDGAGIVVTDYFATKVQDRGWRVIGKRVVFQTE